MRARIRFLVLGFVACACGREASQSVPGASRAAGDSLTVQERRLMAAATIALPPEGFPPESLPDPRSTGAQLTVRFCTQCHALPSPAMHSALDWPGVARRMWVRIEMMAGELGLQSPPESQRQRHFRPGWDATCSPRCAAGATRSPIRSATCPPSGLRSSCGWSGTWSG